MKVTRNELRLGNLLDFEGEVCIVREIDSSGAVVLFNNNEEDWIDLFKFSGIPLTEEWILNFGFIKEVAKVSGGYYYLLDGLAVIVKDGIFYFSIKQLQSRYLRTVDYVHTLQNLCFDLRDVELVLTKTSEPL